MRRIKKTSATKCTEEEVLDYIYEKCGENRPKPTTPEELKKYLNDTAELMMPIELTDIENEVKTTFFGIFRRLLEKCH